MKILPEDFDNAVKQPWSVNTCVVAQAVMRETGEPYYSKTTGAPQPGLSRAEISKPALAAMDLFDTVYSLKGDASHSSLQALRASLPIDLK